MNGGLRAMIANNRAQTPRLRPRPVGRFESGGMSGPDIDTEAAAPEPERVVERVAGERDATVKTPSLSPERTPQESPVRLRDRRLRESTPERSERPMKQAVLHPNAPISAASTPVRDQPETPTVTAVHHHSTEQRIVTPHPVSKSEQRLDDPVRPAPPREPERGALVPPPLPPLPAPMIPRAAGPMNSSVQQADSSSTAPSAEPVVQVSIGRIEVRATPAEPGVRKTEPAHRPAVIGLDDYLSQRGAR
ncbi:hypothetical protein DFR70_10916 [Nocardia tenerifensis]|uniref:Uncharacterized protein n=2 Tax=Nocardia tenerifensis TaxID=228006 RepID=A0A318K0Z8_9NOCA|nr:hypothetical protein DFR70_10916 [Nocardia tenerifensis]